MNGTSNLRLSMLLIIGIYHDKQRSATIPATAILLLLLLLLEFCEGIHHQAVSCHSSTWLEVLQDRWVGYINRSRFHFILLDSSGHDPDPRKWNGPAHLGFLKSFLTVAGCCLESLTPNNPKANFSLVVFDQIRVNHCC